MSCRKGLEHFAASINANNLDKKMRELAVL